MPKPSEQNLETQDVDIEAATASISEDLFGQGEEQERIDAPEGSEDGSRAETVEPPPAQEPPAAEAPKPEEENSQAVQDVGAPKTWTKEAIADWASIPTRAKKEILKREEDFFRGIEGYKAAADLGVRYDTVIAPYRQILEAEKIDPVGLFQSFAANHYLLSRGTDEQKLQLAANLLNGYKIPLEKLIPFMADNVNAAPDPAITALQRELHELRTGLNEQQTAQREHALRGLSSAVDEFADDGQHPYFDEVAVDIANLVQSGQATSLQDAYDKAIWLNPSTRQKELDRIKASELAAAEEAKKKARERRQQSMGDHVETIPTGRDGTVPKGSMDDTLEETYRSITERS